MVNITNFEVVSVHKERYTDTAVQIRMVTRGDASLRDTGARIRMTFDGDPSGTPMRDLVMAALTRARVSQRLRGMHLTRAVFMSRPGNHRDAWTWEADLD